MRRSKFRSGSRSITIMGLRHVQSDNWQMGNINVPVHLACATDELREVMNHVLVTKQYIVASDAHILVRHNTESLFTKEFIEKFPADRLLIHSSAWAKLTESKVWRFAWSETEPDYILIDYISNSNYMTKIRVKKEGDLKYPDYPKVIPTPDRITPFSHISLNPTYIDRLWKAMTAPDQRNAGMSIFPTSHTGTTPETPNSPIVVRPNDYEARHVVGIIMPMMVNGSDREIKELKTW